MANVKALCDIVHIKADEMAAFNKITPYFTREHAHGIAPTIDVMNICNQIVCMKSVL